MTPDKLRIKIYADCAHPTKTITDLSVLKLVKGFTTNPAICRKEGVTDYEAWGRDLAKAVSPRPISFEVFADDQDRMMMQARVIASWGPNIFVKIPVTNTKGESTSAVVKTLAGERIKINVTAIFDLDQVDEMATALGDNPGIISVFAGRIADLGEDPSGTIRQARDRTPKNIEILWASPREVLNVWQANDAGADIITCGPDILAKLALAGKTRKEFSLETVRMFRNDAVAAGYQILDPKSYGAGGF